MTRLSLDPYNVTFRNHMISNNSVLREIEELNSVKKIDESFISTSLNKSKILKLDNEYFNIIKFLGKFVFSYSLIFPFWM